MSNHIRGKEQQNLHRSLHLVLSSWLADWFDRKAWFSTDYSFMTICSGFSQRTQRVPSIVAGKFVHIFVRSRNFFRSSVWFRLKKLGADFNRWWCSSLLGVRISWKWMTQKTRSANFERNDVVRLRWNGERPKPTLLTFAAEKPWRGPDSVGFRGSEVSWLPTFSSNQTH